MMNKSKTSKAWRWKVATFLPLLALLLMAFGNRSEKVPLDENLFTPILADMSQDSVKVWAESDFKSIAGKENEKLFFDGKKFVNVLMNSKSQLLIGEIKCQMADVPERIRRFRDFSIAEDKSLFSKISINGKERMVSIMPIILRRDIATNADDYQKLLNSIGNTILAIRGKYANEIFGKSYQTLDLNQRNEIDKLVPFEIYLAAPKQVVKVSPTRPQITIEIRKDGNYIDNKLCTLEEIGKKAELLYAKYPNVIASIKAESDVTMFRVIEVKEILRNSKILNINQSIAKADISKPSSLPPPPPPSVKDLGFRITIIKDILRVNSKACTFSEIEKMINDINPQKQFIQIDTHPASSKELQSSLKEMLEKKNISYQILWSN